MKRRIFRTIVLGMTATLLFILAAALCVLYPSLGSMRERALLDQMSLAARGVEQSGEAYLRGLKDGAPRLTWVDGGGTVLYDTWVDAAQMENHAAREEIAQALKDRTGKSERASATLTQKTFYLARRLSDGSVLRLACAQNTVPGLLAGLLPAMIAVFAAGALLSALLARRLSARMVAPLNTFDLEHPLENDAYDELTPLLGRIETQRHEIAAQMDELRSRQKEFSAITQSMREGLVLLNDKGAVLSINKAARALFHADGACIGMDFLLLERGRDIERAIRLALSEGRGEAQISREGREYRLGVSGVGDEAPFSGAVLLSQDVTEQVHAERNRREFTANVSHELKTPLQSILGGAELLESGLVKPEDVKTFAGRIHSEAARLVTLVNDIIRLSQLDEGGELPCETVDLYALTRETLDALKDEAAENHLRLSLDGQPQMVRGVPRLIHEIVFNLCDNAIQYNVENGQVHVSVAPEDGHVLLTIADTGIGIPTKYQSRVFERFYRVDKSHSRATGGTGLGLSIVKHAAQQLGAEVGLTSEVGKGTTVTVRFLRCKTGRA